MTFGGMNRDDIKELLESKFNEFHNSSFVDDDPICIPHRFSRQQDIEIAGFFAATFAWGQRVTIINKCTELLELMDRAPFEFITQFEESDLKRFAFFKHRTFNFIDLSFFFRRLQAHYTAHDSLEQLFLNGTTTQERLTHFHDGFIDLNGFEKRTKKHIATPARKSTCKRLNMYLRWMVREDSGGVDFGLWKQFSPANLMCPLDVHVDRVARDLGLLQRKQNDWKTVEELTANLRDFDPKDPVKYDYALFGLGVIDKW